MIKIYDFCTNNFITSYDTCNIEYIQNELEVNGYQWVTIHSIKNEIVITAMKNN